MYIENAINNGTRYLRLVEGYRGPNKDGKMVSKKKIIYNIGPLSRFDDGKPNYLLRLRESFRNGNPLIKELAKYCESKPIYEKYDIEFSENDPFCIGEPKIYSHILIERILEELGLITFFRQYKQFTNIKFDLTGFFRLLVYGRILNPQSKIATVYQNDNYYNPILKERFYKFNVYDTLDFINNHHFQIVNKIHNQMTSSFGRTTNTIFYDCTNLFFHIDEPDDDLEIDDKLVKGVRKNGVSKEDRKLPLIQMGLFIDEQGVPIAIETFPGNTLDHLTVINSLNNQIDNLELKRFIFVGDRGMYNGKNAHYLANKNHGYIMAKSINKSNAKEKEWIYDNNDYISLNPNFKYKSKVVKRTVTGCNGEKVKIVEKNVVSWSLKFYQRQVKENQSFLAFIEKLKENPTSFKISKTESKNIKKLLKDEFLNNLTGEIIDSKDLLPMIDEDKVNKYVKSFGYYQLVTSEVEMDDLEIIETYKGLSKIENQFRILKGNLDARPLFVRTEEHMRAHLLICMIALVVMRIIQNKVLDYKVKNGFKSERSWQMGINGERLQRALNDWTIDAISDEYYRFNNINKKDLKLILDAFDIEIPVKLYKKGELRSLKSKIKIIT